MKARDRIALLCAFAIGVAIPTFPKTGLKGTVTDSAGAPIPGAYIVVHWDSSGSGVGLVTNVGLKQDLILKTDRKGGLRGPVAARLLRHLCLGHRLHACLSEGAHQHG
jgi:hypothetical protein